MIIVCDSKRKDIILEKLNNGPLNDIKFMLKSEFIRKFYFDYDKRAIYFLMQKYHCNCDIAKTYLKNIYYVLDKEYNNEKLDKLVVIKKDLSDNNLLKKDLLFPEFIKNKKIIFDSCDLDNFDMNMIEKLKQITEVEIKDKEYNEYNHSVYEFNTIDEEVEYVAICISKLIDQGVAIKNIKITNINSDYYNSINRIFKMYDLKIKEEYNLYATETVKSFINNYTSDINDTIELLKSKHYDNDIIDQIVDICNSYNFISDYNLVKDLIIDELKGLKITKHYDNEIEIIDLYNNNIKDEYVFMLNYNLESIPKISFDSDYITDDIKPFVNLETSEILNKRMRDKTIKAIKNIKNLVITYKLKTPFASFSKANLLDLESKVVDRQYVNYSTLSNKINLTKMIDNLVKYKEKDKYLDMYYKHFKVDYNSFNNDYKKIDVKLLKEYLGGKLNLSYTSMNDYYKCAFKYYLKYILKIDKNSDAFKRHIGSIFHYVLEQGLKEEIDIEKTVLTYIKENKIDLSSRDKFFLNNLQKELPLLLETIKKQDKYILLKNRLFEETISVDYQKDIDVTFKGIIDKVIYENDIYALVDYKTGSSNIDLTLNCYGINMQLAIYLYLASKRFNEAKFAGFYLQHILSSSLKDDYDTKVKNLKLCGYSNTKYINLFDKTYQDSSLIKSLKIKNDGDFTFNSKVLNDKEVNNLIKLSDKKINECIDFIIDSNFAINPKSIDNKNIGCEFCNYKDICFMKNKDIVNLQKPSLDFLGGEFDA